MPPAIDVFIVNYNAGPLLGDCLSAVRASKEVAVSIHVYDNASYDGSSHYLSGQGLDTLLLGETNLGYNGALKRLLEETRSGAEWVAFITPDVQVRPDAFAKMIEAAHAEDRIGFVAGITQTPDGRLESAGIGYGRSGLAYLRKGKSGVGDLLAPNGGFLCARRAALEEVGIDERLFLYYEEIALGLGALARGWRVILAPEAIAQHRMGGVIGAYPERKILHLALSRRLTIYLYWPRIWIVARLLPIIGVEVVSFTRAMAAGHGRAWLEGWRQFMRLRGRLKPNPLPKDLPVPWRRRLGRG